MRGSLYSESVLELDHIFRRLDLYNMAYVG